MQTDSGNVFDKIGRNFNLDCRKNRQQSWRWYYLAPGDRRDPLLRQLQEPRCRADPILRYHMCRLERLVV